MATTEEEEEEEPAAVDPDCSDVDFIDEIGGIELEFH